MLHPSLSSAKVLTVGLESTSFITLLMTNFGDVLKKKVFNLDIETKNRATASFYYAPCSPRFVYFWIGIVDLETFWFYPTMDHEEALFPIANLFNYVGAIDVITSGVDTLKVKSSLCSFVEKDNIKTGVEIKEHMARIVENLYYKFNHMFLKEQTIIDTSAPFKKNSREYFLFIMFLLQISKSSHLSFEILTRSLLNSPVIRDSELLFEALFEKPEVKTALGKLMGVPFLKMVRKGEDFDQYYSFIRKTMEVIGDEEALQRAIEGSPEVFSIVAMSIPSPKSYTEYMGSEFYDTGYFSNPRFLVPVFRKNFNLLGKITKLLFS